ATSRLARQYVSQIFPFHVLHHEELALCVGEIIDDNGQRRMTKAREKLRFAPERAIRVKAANRHPLDCDHVPQASINRLKDSAHPSLTDCTGDLIPVIENRAGVHCWPGHRVAAAWGNQALILALSVRSEPGQRPII